MINKRKGMMMLEKSHLFEARTFSGESTYLSQVDAGCFDALAMNFSFADDGALQNALPRARARGIAVITRELFQKGRLFKMGGEVGIADHNLLSRLAIKWNLSIPAVTTSLIGADHTDHLRSSLSAVAEPEFTDSENAAFATLRTAPTYKEYAESRRTRFLETEDRQGVQK